MQQRFERLQRYKARKKKEAEKRDFTFIDVGASNGIKCLKWAKNFPKANIYAFEPLPEHFKVLKHRSLKYPNLHVFNYAISTTNADKVPFYVSNDKNCSSLQPFVNENIRKWRPPPGRANFKTKEIITVKTKTLESFLKEHQIKTVDFIKIDAQGHDLNIVKSLGKMLEFVKEIVMEVQIVDFQLYKDAPTKNEVMDFMSKNKFDVFKIRPWSRKQEENIWFTNHKYSRRKENRFFHLNYADKY